MLVLSVLPAGTALLCYVTPREHLGLPDREDVKQVGRLIVDSLGMAPNRTTVLLLLLSLTNCQ